MASASVIIVEDEADLRLTICSFLEMSGIAVRGVADGAGLDQAWNKCPGDILVLDVNLPGESGFRIAERMRSVSAVGIIMMTARAETGDRIHGLGAGADAYLVKPVEPSELLAAIQSLFRRLRMASPELVPAAATWSLDRSTWALIAPTGAAVDLTATEFTILDILLSARGGHISAEDILQRLNKSMTEGCRRSLDAALSRLRRKVEGATGLPLPIKSVRTVGYAFTAAVA